MASCDQQPPIDYKQDTSDEFIRERAATMPLILFDDSPVQKRRTIFDPIHDIFSPEENTSDYLEDYIEKLGEYHVRRDIRHRLQTPLQFSSVSEKDISLNSDIQDIHANKGFQSSVDVANLKPSDIIPKTDVIHSTNRINKKSFELQDLKIYTSSMNDSFDCPKDSVSAPVPSSDKRSSISLAVKSKEVQKSLNAIKTLSSKKIHVDSPKRIQKGFSVDSHPNRSCEKIIETTPRHIQKHSTSHNVKPKKDTNSYMKGSNRVLSSDDKSGQMNSRILKLPKPTEGDNSSVSPEASMKRNSVASHSKTSPRTGRKEKQSKSTMHSFFEAFM